MLAFWCWGGQDLEQLNVSSKDVLVTQSPKRNMYFERLKFKFSFLPKREKRLDSPSLKKHGGIPNAHGKFSLAFPRSA